ncbi:MAG: ClpXP protease specificity-enhancing factor [Burkholderiales bacterium]|nr:ClpXP protease specificity-enhancing factor [Burkholderiales bacterium]MDE1928116.1 ClpXP protease specificity-enhancing factor [Burkholderiales bacterium]MDE2159262.1 ClpXP protease specificity-enhancing factor [Burkholderiales bacterium]MDE2502218.1 ClpXP protease specificity-enhancing factor [Burkholderiales bacterium]
MAESTASTSTRPYLLRALHDWCTDNGYTPYIAVAVGPGVQVPMEYVKNNEIVLNIGFEATSSLQLGNELVEFKARFGGVAREIKVPVDHVIAIYARENGQGMAFPMPNAEGAEAGPAPAPAPVRGLRLASTESEGPVADEAPAATAGADPQAPEPTEPPEPPEPPGGSRPALKRVK